MLEGLEVSEVDFSLVLNSSDDFRLHSEYFSKDFLTAEDYFHKIQTIELSEIATIADGDHAKFPDNQTTDIRYLQARDIKDNFLEISSDVFVSNEYFAKNQRSSIFGESILLSIMGTVGDITITPRDFEPCMCNRALAIIKNIKGISPQFLFAYLTTKHAADNLERLKNGGVQQRINLDSLGKVLIPILSKNFQSKIEDTVILAQNVRRESKQSYYRAESLLLETLGMANFSPSTEKVNIKSFKDSFAATSRLDAEYYQPKYEDYLAHILAYVNGFDSLAKVCNLKDSNFSPNDKVEYQYIELSDINKAGGISGCTQAIGSELPSRARRRVQAGDVLVSSIEGSLTSCAIVTKEYDGALCSTGFYVVDSNAINSESLLVLFKSEIIQNILKQNCSGTILTAISKSELSNTPIPKIDVETQTKIAALVQQSLTLKAESERLLEAAKQAVELAIETNEEAALSWLDSNIADLLATQTDIELKLPQLTDVAIAADFC